LKYLIHCPIGIFNDSITIYPSVHPQPKQGQGRENLKHGVSRESQIEASTESHVYGGIMHYAKQKESLKIPIPF
jgi:hypothetical protein